MSSTEPRTAPGSDSSGDSPSVDTALAEPAESGNGAPSGGNGAGQTSLFGRVQGDGGGEPAASHDTGDDSPPPPPSVNRSRPVPVRRVVAKPVPLRTLLESEASAGDPIQARAAADPSPTAALVTDRTLLDGPPLPPMTITSSPDIDSLTLDDELGLLDDLAEDETGEYEIIDAPRPRKRGMPRGKLKARKVKRIIRYVSPWSVFKVSILFYFCLWVILTIAGAILWEAAHRTGAIANFEKFLAKLFAEESFSLDGRQLARASAIAGVVLVFAATGFTVLMTLLFNVICDLTGGIRTTVLELETTRREVRARKLAKLAEKGFVPPFRPTGDRRRRGRRR